MNLWRASLLMLLGIQSPISSGADSLEILFQQPRSPAEIRPLTAAASAQLANAQVIRGQFVQQRFLRDLPRPLESHGEFLYARDLGVEWRTVAPVESRLVVTKAGVTVQRQDLNGGPARAAPPAGARMIGRLLFGLFGLDFDGLARDFQLFGISSSSGWQVGLRPRRAALARVFRDAVLAGGSAVDMVILRDVNGDRTEISLRDVHFDTTPLSAAERARF